MIQKFRGNASIPVLQVVVVTSGKGGVGKTTTSASFAYGLAQEGFKTVVIDFDIGLRFVFLCVWFAFVCVQKRDAFIPFQVHGLH